MSQMGKVLMWYKVELLDAPAIDHTLWRRQLEHQGGTGVN